MIVKSLPSDAIRGWIPAFPCAKPCKGLGLGSRFGGRRQVRKIMLEQQAKAKKRINLKSFL